ncbi:hypothetical protein CEP52_002599 [Fusarium oligoseptatum]|uniref:FAD dependent oxidoreductase domain-containing protein n=1 Tax=Fusarium oligoseptatum TaxID=2604345 RepID=A0A428UD47_9HYPO|nr:hypothetical protein CEP52_002599 [Fusarium oligoseptatum]
MTANVTILGAGVTGMVIAASLPKEYDVTIVAEHMPGDYDTKDWASPWAGAIWVGVHDSRPHEQKMQLEGFAGLWKIAEKHPESSARQIEMTEIMDRGSKSDVWYADKLPGFRFLSKDELPTARGVKFLRTKVTSLSDLKGLGHDVLINASGFGAQTLRDVQEQNMKSWRLQCVVAKNETYGRLFIRRGPNGYYSTAFSRMDGTVYVGGVLTEGSQDVNISEEHRATICRRAHENNPDLFPSPDPKDWPIIYDHVGVYPTMDNAVAGVSFGLARSVVNLVNEAILEVPSDSKL